MGDIAVPTSQQHMTAGFMLVTMEDVVLASIFKFLFVHVGLSCLVLFQSMLTKIMFAMVVLCSSGLVSSSVAADDLQAEHADAILQAECADDIADEHADDRESEIRKQQLFELIIARVQNAIR